MKAWNHRLWRACSAGLREAQDRNHAISSMYIDMKNMYIYIYIYICTTIYKCSNYTWIYKRYGMVLCHHHFCLQSHSGRICQRTEACSFFHVAVFRPSRSGHRRSKSQRTLQLRPCSRLAWTHCCFCQDVETRRVRAAKALQGHDDFEPWCLLFRPSRMSWTAQRHKTSRELYACRPQQQSQYNSRAFMHRSFSGFHGSRESFQRDRIFGSTRCLGVPASEWDVPVAGFAIEGAFEAKSEGWKSHGFSAACLCSMAKRSVLQWI